MLTGMTELEVGNGVEMYGVVVGDGDHENVEREYEESIGSALLVARTIKDANSL